MIALRAARALAVAYGLSSDIAWMYPTNAKRSGFDAGTSFSMIADFDPTVQLADYLLENFHGLELGLVPNTTRNEEGEVLVGGHNSAALAKRSMCINYNERQRIIWDWVPWNTDFDNGCFGSLSDFYPED